MTYKKPDMGQHFGLRDEPPDHNIGGHLAQEVGRCIGTSGQEGMDRQVRERLHGIAIDVLRPGKVGRDGTESHVDQRPPVFRSPVG